MARAETSIPDSHRMGDGAVRVVILASLALAFCGCPFFGVTQLNRIPTGNPLRDPEFIDHPGVFVHDPTGFAFPEWYENFERVTAYRYDDAGVMVSIGYNDRRPGCLIVATFYLYPALRMTFIGADPNVVAILQRNWLRDEFARSKAEVEAAHPDLERPLVRSSIYPVSDTFVQGPWFGFVEADHLSELHLSLYNRQWFLKYRFTYPASCMSEALSRISTLTQQLPWATAAHPPGPRPSTDEEAR